METKTSFYSDGLKIASILYEPDGAAEGSCPGIVLCQGMSGVKEHFRLPETGSLLAEMGYVSILWDYRGVGSSEGEAGRLYPLEQAEDIRNALTFLELHPKVDPDRLGLMGWSWGGAMVPRVAGVDHRVKAAVSVVGMGDGEKWLKHLGRYAEWLELVDRMAKDRRTRNVTGKSERLKPGELLMPDPSVGEARNAVVKAIPGMADYTGTGWSLATAQKVMEFRPEDVVEAIYPRAISYIAAELDDITPAEGVIDMYHRTREPKKLWVIPGTVHYDVYLDPYMGQILKASHDWF